jgi:hypothetical protein
MGAPGVPGGVTVTCVFGVTVKLIGIESDPFGSEAEAMTIVPG